MYQVIGTQILDESQKRQPAASGPIKNWLTAMKACTANHLVGLKKTFNTVDYKAPFTVFDIGGNKWRLIALVNYSGKQVTVMHFLSHNEYIKGKWRT